MFPAAGTPRPGQRPGVAAADNGGYPAFPSNCPNKNTGKPTIPVKSPSMFEIISWPRPSIWKAPERSRHWPESIHQSISFSDNFLKETLEVEIPSCNPPLKLTTQRAECTSDVRPLCKISILRASLAELAFSRRVPSAATTKVSQPMTNAPRFFFEMSKALSRAKSAARRAGSFSE